MTIKLLFVAGFRHPATDAVLATYDVFCMRGVRGAERLSALGSAVYEKHEVGISHMTVVVQCTLEALKDDWIYPLRSTLETIGVNSRRIEAFPREALLWGPGQMGKVPSAAGKVPGRSFKETRDGPDAAFDILGEKAFTVAKRKSVTANAKKDICKCDRSYPADYGFLVNSKHVEPLLMAQIRFTPSTATAVETLDMARQFLDVSLLV